MPPLCKCGIVREKLTAGPTSNFPGRSFYFCDGPDGCGVFDWADEAPRGLFSQESGPNCGCGRASVQRQVKKEGPNKGRKFWVCACYPRKCKFFEWQNKGHGSPEVLSSPVVHQPKTVAPNPTKLRELPGFATYLSDWKQFEIIEEMMTVDPAKMAHAAAQRSIFKYDSLEVVGVWHIKNPARMERYGIAKEREGRHNNSAASPPLRLPERYTSSMETLGVGLEKKANEAFLLHGTNPSRLHSILFEGLDPSFAHNGNFGRGVYFADHAAKVDEYATEDVRYEKEGPLAELHKRLYSQNLHPTNVRYALIARVVLGTPVRTKDGRTQLLQASNQQHGSATANLFTDESRVALAPFPDGTTPSSLIAEPGQRVRTFREYIIFNADQIFVEYLVAYKRVRSLCDCRIPVTVRTVTATDLGNRGRTIHLCGGIKQNNEKKCAFIQMFPLCRCGKSALIKTSSSRKNPGRKYYSCKSRSCDFFAWVNNALSCNTYGGSCKKQKC